MNASEKKIRVFGYNGTFDFFKPTEEYTRLADMLNLTEWNPVVWIGRLFCLDNDYGEHWFDNHDEKEELMVRVKAGKLGGLISMIQDEGLVLVPDRFQNGKDGPCHSDAQRKRFWTDVLESLELSLETIFEEARGNPENQTRGRKAYITKQINEIKREYEITD